MAVIFFFNLPENESLADVREFIGSFTQNPTNKEIWNGQYLGRPMAIGNGMDRWADKIQLELAHHQYWFTVESFSFSPDALSLLDPLAVAHVAYSICSLYPAEGILVDESDSVVIQRLDSTNKCGPFSLVTDGIEKEMELDPHLLMTKFANLYDSSS